MKFLSPLNNQGIMSVVDVLSMSMLFYGDIKSHHIDKDPSVITELAKSLIAVTRHNVSVKNLRDLAVLNVDPADLVRKVEKNGVVFGVVQGGRA